MCNILNDDGARLLAEALRPSNGAVLGKWIEEGRCAEVDPELWFPLKGHSDREAKAICGECEVRQQCLAYAIEADEEHGVWGGLNRAERIRLRGRMRKGGEAEQLGEGAA
jgi:WhiB family redox-sensing transcriptional regulator